MRFLKVFAIFLIFFLATKYTKIIYHKEPSDTNCECLNCKVIGIDYNLNYDCCKKCFCYTKKTFESNLDYININQNQLKNSILNYIFKSIYEIFNIISNLNLSKILKFFIEIFILLLYDTFIFKLNKYPTLLVTVKLIC